MIHIEKMDCIVCCDSNINLYKCANCSIKLCGNCIEKVKRKCPQKCGADDWIDDNCPKFKLNVSDGEMGFTTKIGDTTLVFRYDESVDRYFLDKLEYPTVSGIGWYVLNSGPFEGQQHDLPDEDSIFLGRLLLSKYAREKKLDFCLFHPSTSMSVNFTTIGRSKPNLKDFDFFIRYSNTINKPKQVVNEQELEVKVEEMKMVRININPTRLFSVIHHEKPVLIKKVTTYFCPTCDKRYQRPVMCARHVAKCGT